MILEQVPHKASQCWHKLEEGFSQFRSSHVVQLEIVVQVVQPAGQGAQLVPETA